MNKILALIVLWTCCWAGAADDGRLDKRELEGLTRPAKAVLAFSAAAKGRIADFKTLMDSECWYDWTLHDYNEMPVPYRQKYFFKLPNGERVTLTYTSAKLSYLDAAVIHNQEKMARFLIDHYPKSFVGFSEAIAQDHGALVDGFAKYMQQWDEGFDLHGYTYPKFALAVVLGKEIATQSFLSHYGIRYPDPKHNTSIRSENSSLFALAAVNGHPLVLRQLVEAEYRRLRDKCVGSENARIAAVKSSLPCLPSALVREVCAYKGAELRVRTWKGLKLESFVLPSAAPDLQGKTPVDYAQAELGRSENEDERTRLSACLDLLKNQDTNFMNFLFDEHEKAKS